MKIQRTFLASPRLMLVSLFLAVLSFNGLAQAQLTSVSVTPNNSTVGEQSIYIVSFTTNAVWPANGELTIDFPTGFDASTVAIANGSAGVDGGFTASGAGVTATLIRDNTGTAVSPSTAVTIVVANVTNRTVTGTTYTADVTTHLNGGTDIETGTSSNFSLTPAGLNTFAFSSVPGSATAGVAFNGVVVTARDAFGNDKTDYTGTVSWSSTDGSATLPSDSTFAGASHTFNGFVLETSGSQTITATDGSVSTDSSITVNAAAAASFSISNPGTQTAGDGFSLSITGAQDAFGNAVSGTATIAFSDAGAHNSPDTTPPTLTNITVTNGSGSATQVLVNAESGVQLEATLGAVSQTTSAFTVNATSLDSYTLSDPGNQTAGTGFSLSITAAVDTYGNGVNGTATVGFVGFGSHDSPDGFSPALQNIAVTASSPGTGNATQTLYNEETGVQLYTTMGGINDTTAAFNVAEGALNYVSVLTGASGNTSAVGDQTVGAGTNIVVHAGGFDGYGNYRSDESVNWTVSGGIGSLSSGSGTSTTLTASTSGSGAITADHASATDGVSGTITVTTGALSYVTVVEGLSGDGDAVTTRTLTAGQSLTVHAAGYDASDNYLGDFSVTWTVSGGIGSFSAGTGANTVFTAETTGSGAITADHATATDDASGTITVNPGALSTFAFSSVPGSATAGVAFNGVVVTARDAFGNDKTDYTGTASWSSTDGSATLPSDSTFAGASHTFNGFVLETAGNQTMTVTDGGVSKESSVVTVSAAAAASFSISNPGTQTAGDGFSLSITGAQDAFGNAVSGTATIAFSDAGAHNSPDTTPPTLTNITVTNGSGSATQVLVNAESGVQLEGTLGGVSQTTSAFTVNATSLDSYTLSDPGNQTAGSGFSFSITAAVDTYGNGVNGTATVAFVGAGSHDSPDGFSPALQNIAVTASSPGTGNATQTLYNEETGVQLYTTMGGINDTTAAFNVSAAALDHFDFNTVSDPQTAGTPFSVTINARDPYGNTAAFGGTVNLNDNTGTISPTTSGTFVAGTWTGDVTIDQSQTADRITATGAGQNGTSNSFDVDPGALDHFTFAQIASPQTAGTAFSITITAEDANNNTVTSFSGTVNLSDDTGTITPFTSGSFTNGVWTGNVTLTQSQADVQISASGSGQTGNSNNFNVDPGALDHFAVATVSSPQTAAAPFAINITAQDANNNTVTSFTGTVDITDLSGTISPVTSGSFVNGVRSENVTVTLVQNNNRITVTNSAGAETGQSNLFNVTTTDVDHFLIAAIASPQTAGAAFSITVTAQDASNNTVTDFNGTVSLDDLTNTISPSTSGSFVNGVWTGNVTMTQSQSNNRITVTGAGKSSDSNLFDVDPDVLDHFAFAQITTPQVAGTAFSVTITAQDQFDNTVTSFSSTVNLSDDTGTITPTVSGNFTNGVWTDNVTITQSQSDVQITASGSGQTGQSNNFNVDPGVLDHFAIATISSPQTAGAPFAITITAQDANNNTVTGFTGSVDITDVTTTISPATSGNFVNGVRTENVSVTLVQTNNQVTVTNSAGVQTGQSNQFDVTTTSVDHFLISAVTSPQTAGTPFSITVTAQDASNNTVTGFNGSVLLSDLSNTISPSTSGSFINGVWTGDVTVTGSLTNNIITVTGAGKSNDSNQFDVVHSVLDHFTFAQVTSPQVAGTPFSITVTAEDQFNNTVTGFGATVGLSDDTGTLTPPLSGTFTNGVWTGDVTITQSQADVQITAQGAGQSGQSNNFNVDPGVLDHFAVATISSPQTASAPFAITITAQDANNNTVIGFSGTVDITDLTTTIGPATSGSFVNGVRTENVTVTLVQANNQITVTNSAGLETGLSNLFDVTTTNVDHFLVAAIASPQTAGTAFSLTVTAQDQSNNTVTDFVGSVSFSDLTNTISPDTSTAFVNGVWTGTVSITQSRISNRITVTGAGKSSDSNVFDVVADTLDHFLIDPISSPQTAGAGIAMTVTAKDQFENTVLTFAGTANLSDNTTTISPVISGGFVNGVWSDVVTITKAQQDVVVTATSASASGLSNSFNVIPAVVAKILIRDGALGSGTLVGDVSLTLDESISLYAAGYDQFDNFSRDVVANWSITGDLDAPSPASGIFTVFDPITPNTSGMIVADSTGLTPDSTGTITVGSIASIKIRDAAGGLGNEIANFQLSADDSLTLFAAGYDAANNFVGDVQADWLSAGLFPALSEVSVLSVTFSPTTAPVSGTITAQHATAGSAIVNMSVIPGNPAGNIVMTATPTALVADSASTSVIDSDVIVDADSNQVEAGKLITVSTTLGSIITPDDSPIHPGIQVTTNGQGKINFVLQAGVLGGTANLTAVSVQGGGFGTAQVQITNLSILSIEAPALVSQGQDSVPVTMTVANVGSQPIVNVTAQLTFTGFPPGSQNYNGDFANRQIPLPQIPANTTLPIDFTVDVSGTATTGTPIVVDGSVNGDVNTVPVTAQGAVTPDTLTVQTSAELTIVSVSANTDTISQGQQNIPVTMTVQNIGQALANIDSALLSLRKGASPVNSQYVISANAGNPTTIAGGAIETFNFIVDASATAELGSITTDGTIFGHDDNSKQPVSDIGSSLPGSWTVVEASVLQLTSLLPTQATVTQDQDAPWDVWMFVRNNGGSTVRFDSARISIFIGTEVTSQYTISVPTGFWNDGVGSTTLAPGTTDSVRFTISKTGTTLGTATIQGRLNVTDLLSNDPAVAQNDGNPASVIVQTPADLRIVLLTHPKTTGVTVGQTADWTVSANIQNLGGSTILIDPSPLVTNLTFIVNNVVRNDYAVFQPTGLSTGGFELAGGQAALLDFVVDQTGNTPGVGFIDALVSGIELNSNRAISNDLNDILRPFLLVETPPQLSILSTTVNAPNAPDVNTGQSFSVDVILKNDGQDRAKNVFVDLTSTGESVFSSPLQVFLVSGNGATASFQVTASVNTALPDSFTATILSAAEENTNAPALIFPATDSTASINLEAPAGLKIVSVFPSDSTVNAGQGTPNFWDIFVVVQDTGSASLTLNPFAATDIAFRLGGELQGDYIVNAPTTLSDGDLILEGGELDTLAYRVITTGRIGGDVDITVNLSATDENDGSVLFGVGSGAVEVKSAAFVQIISTEIVGVPHLVGLSDAEVNTSQNFRVQAVVENRGIEIVQGVGLSVVSNGGSTILDSSIVLSQIQPGARGIFEFDMDADLQENIGGETFTVRIDSATSSVSGLPALVQQAIDSTAAVFVENPAQASLSLTVDDQDGIFSAGQAFEATAVLVNSGRSLLTGLGRVELVIPENYELVMPGDTSHVARDTLDIQFGVPVTWNLFTPQATQGPDTLAINILAPPNDENTGGPAVVKTVGDSLEISTLAGEFNTQAEILSPSGATDGTVSSEQEFTLRASIVAASQNLTSRRATLIGLPANYQTDSPLTQDYVNGVVEWVLDAPVSPDQQMQYLVIQSQAQDERDSTIINPPDSVGIMTVLRSNLTLSAFISEPQGAIDGVLSASQPFVIRAIVRNQGQARVENVANIRLNLGATGITVQEPLIRAFVFQPGQDESDPIDWNATAPAVPTSQAPATITIDTTPFDENSNQLAQVSNGQEQIALQTQESAQLTNTLSITSPLGAQDFTLSTEQEFIVQAMVTSNNAIDVISELIFPPGSGFFTENATRPVTPGSDVVSWRVIVPSAPASDQVIQVRTQAKDANNTTQDIFSAPDSITVEVVQKPVVSISASIPGAPEGIVSILQEFVLTAVVNVAGAAGTIGEATVRLQLPDGFTTVDDSVMQTNMLSASWTIRAPAQPTVTSQNIFVFLDQPPLDINTGNSAAVQISVSNVTVTVDQKKLEIESDAFGRGSLADGEQAVPVFGLLLRNGGVAGSSSILITQMNFYVVDENGEPISPASVFSSISLRNRIDPVSTIYATQDAPSANPIQFILNPPIELRGGELLQLGVYVDLLPSVNANKFFITFQSEADIIALDSNTNLPVSLVDTEGNLVRLSDMKSGERVVVDANFNTSFGNYPNPFGRPDSRIEARNGGGLRTNFVYFLEGDTDVELKIYTLVGDLVRSYQYSAADPQGREGMHDDGLVTWDAKNGDGQMVMNGIYVAILTTASGQRAVTKVAVVK